MKKQLLFLAIVCFVAQFAKAQVCAGSGNLMIYTNYDGGILNINVDQNIPNLKIGICSYEPVQVNLSGAYVGNITQVVYAGFNSTQNNNNCNLGNFITAVAGVPSNIVDIQTFPAANLQNPNGYPYIICAYQCDTIGSQGGCNTVDQVVAYLTQQTGGILYAHYIQYACWSGTYNVSAGGTCCITAPGLAVPPPQASFTSDTTTNCPDGCFNFTNTSSGGPFTSFIWNFPGSSIPTSNLENPTNVCYQAPGVYPVTLTVANAGGSDADTINTYITILNPVVTAQFTYFQVSNYQVDFANTSSGATSYTWIFPDSTITTPNASLNFPSEGVYPVTLIATGPCGADTTTINVTVLKTALAENIAKSIAVYPNPAAGKLYITAPTNTTVSYSVYNVVGQQVTGGTYTANNPVDVATLTNGMYYIRLNVNGYTVVKRFVKE